MYSKAIEEIVFIDYGFSKIIFEDIGFQTSTIFAGSFSYWTVFLKEFLTFLSLRSPYFIPSIEQIQKSITNNIINKSSK